MTGYTVHTGSNDKFASGWDQIFGGKPKRKAAPASAEKKTAAKAAPPKKDAGGKPGKSR